MNKKTTRRALFLSFVSMFLCFTMLVGTTYAWFTDSVTSGANQIVAGNLDVELDYWKNGAWVDVDGKDDLFVTPAGVTKGAWEPGHVEVAYLKLTNAGDLALKYQLGVNVSNEVGGKNVNNELFKLSDYIYFNVVAITAANDAPATYADRAAALTAAETGAIKLNQGFTKADSLAAEAEPVYLAVVAYMPTTVGNEANYMIGTTAPTIDLGVSVFATQMEAEEDSFGSDYDKDAVVIAKSEAVTLPAAGTPATEGATLTTPIDNNVTLDLPAALLSDLAEAQDAPEKVALSHAEPKYDTDNGIVTFDHIELVDENGEIIDLETLGNTQPITVKFNVGNAFAVGATVRIYHDGAYVCEAIVDADKNVTYTATHFCEVVVSDSTYISTAAELATAFANGGKYMLANDIAVDADNTMTVPADKTVVLNLNGKTIAGVSDDADKNDDGKITSADNEVMIDVRGDLTVKNGTITIKHESDNLGWNGCTEVFYVGFNATLNVENATIENLGGSDMAYAIDLVNADKAKGITLNVTNSTLKSSYIALRVFNNGQGMNNVTVKNTDLIGTSRAFWVHIYSNKDNGGKGVKDATLNLNVFGNGNTFTAKNPNRIIEFGFDDEINFDANGNQIVTVSTMSELVAAVKGGAKVIDAQGANLGDFYYDVVFTDGIVVKNAKFTYVYGASVDGVATFENCEFVSDHSYCANFSDGNKTGKVIFNNCLFDGWSSFGDLITYVEMNNCEFKKSYNYGIVRFYQNAKVNNCTFAENFEGVDTNKTGTVVELNNCTGIEDKIYNNGSMVGTWIVDGVTLTDVPTW